MKNAFKKSLLLSLALCASSLSFAGGVGNGGVSVVCRNQSGKISSAQVLDIYEGEVRFGRKYDNAVDADEKIELAQLKLARYPGFLRKFQEEVAKARAIMLFVPNGNRLIPTDDALPKIEKVECGFEQLANYIDETELLISQEIYDELDEVNKAALLVHETVYAILRKMTAAKDSQVSRKLTAHLLAKNGDQKVIEAILDSYGNSLGKRVCGLIGTIDERIKDCNQGGNEFSLVARTVEGEEVHKELSTGLLWSDRLPNKMNHYNAEKACIGILKQAAGITGFSWRLPSEKEYEQAEKHGARKALPNVNDWSFWTKDRSGPWVAVISGGNSGRHYVGYRRDSYYFVRCVAR